MVSDPCLTMITCHRLIIWQRCVTVQIKVYDSWDMGKKEQSESIAEVQLLWMITYEEGRTASNCTILQDSFLLESKKQSLYHCIPCCERSCGKLGSLSLPVPERGAGTTAAAGEWEDPPIWTCHSCLFFPSAPPSCDEETTSLASPLYPFCGITVPAPVLRSCSSKITLHSKTHETA